MRKKIRRLIEFLLLFTLLALVIVPELRQGKAEAATWTANACYCVNYSGGIPLRQKDDQKSSVLTTVPNSTYLFVMKINVGTGWGYTCYNGNYGYVELAKMTRRADAPETTAELELRMKAVRDFYPDGSRWKGSLDNSSLGVYTLTSGGNYGPSTCFGFACEVWRALFGCEMATAYVGAQQYLFWTNPQSNPVKGNMRWVGTLNPWNYNATDVKNLLMTARTGDIIQSRINAGTQHTMIVVSTTAEGIYILDANVGGSNTIRNVKFYTYESYYTERPGGISLYTCVNYPPEKPLPVAGGAISVKNSSGAAVTSVYEGDRIKLSASVSNARNITYYIVNKATGATAGYYTTSIPSYTGVAPTYDFVFPTGSAGTYKVYYYAWNSGYNYTSSAIEVKVSSPSVSITGSSLTTYVGQRAQIEFAKYPSNAKVVWTSSNNSIVTVYSTGEIIGQKKGTATVTATVSYTGTGGVTSTSKASINVTVLNPSYTLTFNVNDSSEDKASISTTSKTVTWNELYGTLPTPTRTGYTFDGWYTAKTGGTEIADGVTVTINASHTAYAHWVANNYNITFDNNTGSGSQTSSKQVAYRSTFGWMPTPKREGYTFLGWYTAKGDSETGTTAGTKITADTKLWTPNSMTLYANWKRSVFKVNLDATGGTVSPSYISVTYGEQYGTIPDPTRKDYVFLGWFTAKDGGTEVKAGQNAALTTDITIYAHWKRVTFYVTFDAMGGTVSQTSKAVSIDKTYGDFPDPSRVGYTFVGWFTEKTGGKQINPTDTVTANDITAYARWKANNYKTSFDANGGSVSETEKTVVFDSPYGTLPVPVNAGFEFLGWYTKPEGGIRITEAVNVTTAENHILYAHWENGKFSVILDAGKGSCATDSISVTYLEPYGTIPVALRTGYTFAGWFTEKDGGKQIVAEDTFTEVNDQTIYAHWVVNTYRISFTTNSVECGFDPISVDYDAVLGELPVPVKRGYTFKGWFLEGETEARTSESVLDKAYDITLSAVWTANTYRLILDANAGTVENGFIPVQFDKAYGTIPVATRFGYIFTGWYTQLDGGEIVSSETMMTDACDITVFAHWEARHITLSFDPAGGVVENITKDVVFDDAYGEFPVAERVGYSFVCWQNIYGEKVYETDIVNVEEDCSFTAVWEALKYTIKLNVNGGEPFAEDFVNEITVTYDDKYPVLPTPVRMGYRFVGWRTDASNHAYSGDRVKITYSQVLYADWVPLMFVYTFDTDGGKMQQSSIQVYYDDEIPELPVPTRRGYEFGGWMDEDMNEVKAGDKVLLTDNVKLTAKWTPLRYRIYFYAPDGKTDAEYMDVEYDSYYGNLPGATREGYSFAHWETAEGMPIYSDMKADIVSDLKLYAVWNAIDYYVQFNTQSDVVVPSRMATYDSEFGTLPEVTRDGYEFAGWFLDGNLITISSMMTYASNIEITAHWNPVVYTVTFDAAEGISETDSMTFTCDDTFSFPTAIRAGYQFNGWNDENGNRVVGAYDAGARNLTLTAQWTPVEYTVYFSVDEIIDSSLTKTIGYNEQIGALRSVSREGLSFNGWVDSQGNPVDESYVHTKTTDIILYADLIPNTYKLKFYPDGGVLEANTKEVTYREEYGELPEPIKRGYVFSGWHTQEGKLVKEDDIVRITENTALYADWIEITAQSDLMFKGNSMITTGCEILGAINILLFFAGAWRISSIRHKKKNEKQKAEN